MDGLTLAAPLEAPVLVTDAAVEVHLGVDVLAILASDAATQPAALVDSDGWAFGGEVEVGHVGYIGSDEVWLRIV